MACALTSSLSPKACKTPAGIDEFLVTERGNLDADPLVDAVTIAANIVTAIALTTGKQFRKYVMKPGQGNFKVTPSASGANGSFAYAYEVTGKMLGIDTSTQEELHLLLQNTLVVIVKKRDGTYWLLGHEYGMDFTSGNYDSGTASGDFDGDTITLTGEGNVRAKKVDSAIIAGLLAPAL